MVFPTGSGAPGGPPPPPSPRGGAGEDARITETAQAALSVGGGSGASSVDRARRRDEFVAQLEAWVTAPGQLSEERRATARDSILDCFDNNRISLGLEFLKLSNLPRILGQLSSLQFLALSYNHISTLPEDLGNLAQLQQLFVTHNNIALMPI